MGGRRNGGAVSRLHHSGMRDSAVGIEYGGFRCHTWYEGTRYRLETFILVADKLGGLSKVFNAPGCDRLRL